MANNILNKEKNDQPETISNLSMAEQNYNDE